MAEVRCPMCGKNNPSGAETCQFCEARLVPLAPGSLPGETPTFSTSSGASPDEPDEQSGDWLDDLRADDEEDFSYSEPEESEADSQDWLGRLDVDSEPQTPAEEPLRADLPSEEPQPLEPPVEESPEPPAAVDPPSSAGAPPAEEEDLPEWLKSIEAQPPGEGTESDEATETQEIPGMVFKQGAEAVEEGPDWLKDETQQGDEEPAGEGALESLASDFETIEIPGLATAAAQGSGQEPSFEDETPEDSAAPEAEPAELPDWLSDQAEQPPDAGELPDWLSEGADEAEDQELTIPPPVAAQDPADEQDEQAEPGEIPDWLSAAAPAAAAASAMKDSPAEPPESGEAGEEPPAAEPGDLPDWLSEEEPEVLSAAEAPGAGEVFAAAGAEEEPPAAEPGDLPDWLSEETPEELPAAEGPGAGEVFAAAEAGEEPPAAEPGDLPDWLSEEAPEETVDAEVLHAAVEPEASVEEEPDIEPGDQPDWLSEEAAAAAVIAAGEAPEEPVADLEAESGELPGWLEEESEEESGEIPDWLKAGAAAAAVGAAAKALGGDDDSDQPQDEDQPAAEETELPEWLQEEQDRGTWEVEAEVPPSEEPEEIPDWVHASEAEAELPAGALDAATPELEGEEWLAAIEGQPEADLPLSLEDEDVPDWLKSLQNAQQEAGEGAAVQDLEGLQAVDDPGEIEEGDIPDWLEELSFAVPAVAVEAGGDEDFMPVDEQVEGQEELPEQVVEGEEVETILPGVLQDAFDDSEDMDISPEDVAEDDELEPADLPGWLKAMRPVEAVAAVSPFIEEGEPGQSVEGAGPLAGLQGVLPAETDYSQAGSSAMVSTRVDVTKNQYDHVALLRGIVKEEAEPALHEDKRPFIQPGHVLRWIIALALIAFLALPAPVSRILASARARMASISSRALRPSARRRIRARTRST